MATLNQLDDLARAEAYFKRTGKKFIRVRDMCEVLKIDRKKHKKATRILRELEWYKFNGYQWAHPSTKGRL